MGYESFLPSLGYLTTPNGVSVFARTNNVLEKFEKSLTMVKIRYHGCRLKLTENRCELSDRKSDPRFEFEYSFLFYVRKHKTRQSVGGQSVENDCSI